MFGVNFVLTQRASDLLARGDQRVVRTLEDGSEVTAPAIILATGVSWRRIGIPALDALIGAGVFYGAAGAEAKAMTGREAFIVGAGNPRARRRYTSPGTRTPSRCSFAGLT